MASIMAQYFKTKEEAEEYKESHELYARSAEYLPCVGKWALVFNIKAQSKDEKEA